MTITVGLIIFMVGLAMIIVAVIGGGVEIKEFKIPVLPLVPRIASFVTGCLLIALTPYLSRLLELAAPPAPQPVAQSNPQTKERGSAITLGIVTVRDVKKVLNHLGYYRGPINDDPDQIYFQAVADFQISQKVTADGLVGGETYPKLKEAWPEYFAINDGLVGTRAQGARPTSSPVSTDVTHPSR